MKLLIVESPNKIRKIKHYLGSGYEVAATVGHFRDLPTDALGVDLATFEPTYVVSDEKRSVVSKLKALAAKASEVLLATDPDREGEAISWHVAQVLRLRNARRVRFHEITEKALQAAVQAAGPVDQDLVNAQQARRVLDRLVGYQVSPLLRPFGRGHSAGRVQSATLHLIVFRELAREAFKPEPYWTVTARYREGFSASYATLDGKGQLVPTRAKSQAEAEAIAARAKGPHAVEQVELADRERRPKPPFTTSTLQQAASVQLRLAPERTMALAQALFEQGLISYHRTDSVALSGDAVAMARRFIEHDYPAALPKEPPRYQSKASAQEAHEAIRPTSMEAPSLAGDEARLYDLVRRRFLASQCKPAIVAQTTVRIRSGDTFWRAVGEVVKFDGFLHYLAADEETHPDAGAGARDDAEQGQKLPSLAQGQALALAGIDVQRKETKPPPRFTRATLIREMEKTGIGRPSTYANTVALLFQREYLAEERRYVYPIARGRLIDEMLGKAFPDLLATAYTALLEERLDQVAEGKRRWKDELREWYGPFSAQLARAAAIFGAEVAKRPEVAAQAGAAPKLAGRLCPRCGAELFLRPGKRGEFLACSTYPKCDYAADPSAAPHDQPCPICQGSMERRQGQYGPYARCLQGDCNGVIDLAPAVEETCPICKGAMRDKGKFLSCARYPECRGSYDKKGLEAARKAQAKCPDCGAYLIRHKGKRGDFLGCGGYPGCRYTAPCPAGPKAPRRAGGPKRSDGR